MSLDKYERMAATMGCMALRFVAESETFAVFRAWVLSQAEAQGFTEPLMEGIGPLELHGAAEYLLGMGVPA